MDYVYIVIMAVVCQIGAHAVFNMCIGHVSSLYVSTWEAGEPVFATAMAFNILRTGASYIRDNRLHNSSVRTVVL